MKKSCKTCARGETDCLYVPVSTLPRTTLKLTLTYQLLCNNCPCRSVNDSCNRTTGGCMNWAGQPDNPEDKKK